MNIVGEMTAIFRDIHTGEITKTVTEKNHIQDTYLKRGPLQGEVNQGDLYEDMFISENNPGRQRRDWPSTIVDCYGGTPITGIVTPQVFLYDAPGIHLGQWVSRWEAPPTNLTINTVGICATIGNTGIQDASGVDTVVWLSNPCPFLTNETLDIYYRIQVLFNENWKTAAKTDFGITGYTAELLANYILKGLGSFPIGYNDGAIVTTALPALNSRRLDRAQYGRVADTKLLLPWVNEISLTYWRKGRKYIADIFTDIGEQISHAGTEGGSLMHKAYPEGMSPLQSVFGHRSTSVTPFYFAAEAQLGLGSLTINADTWPTLTHPEYVRLDITTTGNVGVGAYKMRRRKSYGFVLNTFMNGSVRLPYSSAYNGHFNPDNAGVEFALCRDHPDAVTDTYNGTYTTHAMNYTPTESFFVWNDSFSITTLLTGEGVSFNNTTLVGTDLSPFFLATSITQIAVAANLDFYIACENTGMYKFNAALDTLTVIDTGTTGLTGVVGCQGVCIGNAGRVWAYFRQTVTADSTLYYSDDDGASWTSSTMSDATLDANPIRVMAIQADPSNVLGQLIILYRADDTDTPYIETKWWDQATTTVSTGPRAWEQRYEATTNIGTTTPPGHHYHLGELIKCSPNQSVWAMASRRLSITGKPAAAFLTFGSVATTGLAGTEELDSGSINTYFIVDNAGNDALFFLSQWGETNNAWSYGNNIVLLSTDLTYETGTIQNTNASSIDSAEAILYLGEGVWLAANGVGSTGKTTFGNLNTFYMFSCVPEQAHEPTLLPALMAEVYPEYGWDGGAWVKGHAGQKTLHAGAEVLFDNVTVAWDDTGGTTEFKDSDHYTFGLFDGVWLDGSTSFDYTAQLYAKPTTQNTETESATLPVVQRIPNVITNSVPSGLGDFQDIVESDMNAAGAVEGTLTGTDGVYSAGARSANPAILGDTSSYLPNNVRVPYSDIVNVQGWVEFTPDVWEQNQIEQYMGISPIGQIGNVPDGNTIAHAFHVDSITPGSVAGMARVRVVESGVERFSIDNVPYSSTDILRFRIALLNDGSMVYEYWTLQTMWKVLYQSAPGSVTVENMYLDCAHVPRNNYGWEDIQYNYLDTGTPDYYMYLGDGINQGLFAPDFLLIDGDYVTITIDGTEAINVGVNDTASVLAANSYSIFPTAGLIRFSASDVGKTVTADYVTITDT